MLTALLTLTLIASPYPGEAPAALPFFGGAADGPDAAGYVIVPAETTGYAYIKDDGRQGVVRGELTYGYLEWAKYWTYYAGFLIFELDVIPERAVVASADMDYFQYRSTSGDESVPFDVRTFSYEKHLGGMEMLRRVESGLRVSDTVLSREGWNRVTLWPSGIAAVDSCRRQGDFLALGMARIFYLYYLDCRGYAYGHDAVPEYLPYLRIGYLWIYPDVGTAMLIEPADTVVTGVAITPRALVRNHSADTLSFPVRFTIGTGYTSETTMTLEPGTEDMVRFAPWIPQDTGRFEVKCSTMLAGDEDQIGRAHV